MTFRRDIKQNKNSGFTLVEMIVVLVILGILASVAVYSIINYINMTRYNSNQQNAISIFQSAHSSLNHMSEAGTLDFSPIPLRSSMLFPKASPTLMSGSPPICVMLLHIRPELHPIRTSS